MNETTDTVLSVGEPARAKILFNAVGLQFYLGDRT